VGRGNYEGGAVHPKRVFKHNSADIPKLYEMAAKLVEKYIGKE
jgi:hypothetical protein